MRIFLSNIGRILSIFLIIVFLTGCPAKKQMNFVSPNFYEQKELKCIRSKVSKDIILTVGDIPDLTGRKESGMSGSHFVSEAATQMMVTSLIEGGAKLVNRHDVNIIKFEKNASKKDWLGNKGVPREVKEGSLKGSNFYITGSISTLDFNTNASGLDLYINGVGLGSDFQEILVGGDFIVTNTITSEIVYAKIIYFKLYVEEVNAGVFHLYDEDLITFNVGYCGNDPLQMAIRYIVDKAAVGILRKINNIKDSECNIMVKGNYKDTD
jgi:curli biogenesis system outer membrane secretion channel CsgG